MAEAFPGIHYRVCCQDCGFFFRCGAAYVPRRGKGVCPNCGFPDNELEEASRVLGQRVLIDRWSNWVGAPKLWQPLAFASPERDDYLAIKRVVARGSGRVAIRDGDVFVDEKIQRKTLAQLRRLGILVHDDRYRPGAAKGLPNRWCPAQPDSRWCPTAAGYHRKADRDYSNTSFDWLEYDQWTCWPSGMETRGRTGPAPILDHYAYNQNVSRSRMHEISDLMVQCRMSVRGTGRVALRLSDGADHFRLTLEYPTRQCYLKHNGHLIEKRPRSTSEGSWDIEFALCDHQVLASLDRTVLFQHNYQPAEQPRRGVLSPPGVGTSGLEVRLDSLRVYRDLYYLGPIGERRWTASEALNAHQCFVLGDNVPVSIDSRHLGPLNKRSIIGSVAPLAGARPPCPGWLTWLDGSSPVKPWSASP